jgi:hypothetical protein
MTEDPNKDSEGQEEFDEAERERQERLRERREELEEELEMYAQSGVSSPGLLKAARWVSRGLYFAMAALVVFLLFSGWGKVSQQDFETLQRGTADLRKQLGEVRTERDEYARDAMRAESELRQAQMVLERSTGGPAAADQALGQASRLLDKDDFTVRWAREWREETRPPAELLSELEQRLRESEEDARLELVALMAHAAGEGQSALMRNLATGAERPLAERIIAVRWLAERKEEGESRRVLEALAEGDGVLAQEAAMALQRE